MIRFSKKFLFTRIIFLITLGILVCLPIITLAIPSWMIPKSVTKNQIKLLIPNAPDSFALTTKEQIKKWVPNAPDSLTPEQLKIFNETSPVKITPEQLDAYNNGGTITLTDAQKTETLKIFNETSPVKITQEQLDAYNNGGAITLTDEQKAAIELAPTNVVTDALFNEKPLGDTQPNDNNTPTPASTPNANSYTLSETFTEGQSKTTSIEDYFSNLYYFLLGAAAVLAVLKIVMGGLKYVAAAGNPNSISDAREDIQWAIFGLVLALSSFLILKTIGGDSLVSFDIRVPAPTAPSGANGTGVSGAGGTTPPGTTPLPTEKGYYFRNSALINKDMTGDNWTSDEKENLLTGKEAATALKDAGIQVINGGTTPLSQNCMTPCTSLNGMPEITIDTMVETKKNCPTCGIVVTGGTESGHQKQGFGEPSIDLRYNENTYKYLLARQERDNIKIVREAHDGDPLCKDPTWECHSWVTAPHMSLYNPGGGSKNRK